MNAEGWRKSRVQSLLYRNTTLVARFVKAQANFLVGPIAPAQASLEESSRFASGYLRIHGWKRLAEGQITVEGRAHYTVTYMLGNQWPNKKYSICLQHPLHGGLVEVALTLTCYSSVDTFRAHEGRFDEFASSLRAEGAGVH